MHFQGLGSFRAESVSGSAFGKDLACIWVDVGADWGTHWEPLGLCFSVWGLLLWYADFLCFSEGFPGPVKISSRAEVDAIYVISGALHSNTAIQQYSNIAIQQYSNTGDKFPTFTS